MNCLCINTRGFGEAGKISWVKRLKMSLKINFIRIQETWLDDYLNIDVRGCWDSSDFDSEGVNAVGRSGGLLCIWNNRLFKKEEVFKDRYFLIVIGRWQNIDESMVFVNVYGPHNNREKSIMWSKLLHYKNSIPGIWVVFGDFNDVRRPEERLNSIFCPRSTSRFNSFIQTAGLHEFNMGGHRFTYFCQDGAKLSKLDRFLVCSNFLARFQNVKVTAHPRELSDHFPVSLTTHTADFGPLPFKFFNSWLHKEDLCGLVNSAWDEFCGFGTADAFLAAKLRHVKKKIRNWRNNNIQAEKKEFVDLRNLIENLDQKSGVNPLSISERSDRNRAMQRLLELERLTVLDLKQKARIRWIIDGDENSRFFHGVVNNRNQRHKIHGLSVGGRWTEDVTEIRNEIYSFFRDKFKEPRTSRPKLINPLFRTISFEQAEFLESPILIEEVKTAIWECGSDRAPGPDGFTFKFLKTFWELMKEDIMKFVHHFEEFGTFAKGCNSSFITLAPKVKDPMALSDYRPISLIGCLYKIIAKLLALGLKKVIGSVIGEEQSAYVEGRNILDGPLVINEVCSWAKRSKKKLLLLKVDFDKAFDSINWEYLDSVLSQMRFGGKWRAWISGCLKSSRASVLVNGAPTDEFDISRGLDKATPSPHSFLSLLWRVSMWPSPQLDLKEFLKVLAYLMVGLLFLIYSMRMTPYLWVNGL